ncbi:hypothetical protein CAEBREN_30898 [Caenorhabditis brenneri]|uniref:Uncharacterized protein n=1 Tax=Caenorhabditis brenneri TaxID=135651 RepID=G0PF42_CAEBE|nr:hypothetical protein CAEBREN_30898 [Caenorhabditis brenneri]
MLTSNVQRTAKISRDVSNFIITLVLEHSDDLIKNSYRRLTTENVARNEHWSRIAEKVADKFDMPAEMERVKSHFHNRKKVLLSRIKDELRTVPNSATWTTDEKMDELVRRRICIGEYDEQLARVCLDIEEEEKGRTDSFGTDQVMQPVMSLFTETSQQSLLSQLLSSSGPSPQESKSTPIAHLESLLSRGSEPRLVKPPAVSAPLLTKLLTDPSTSIENGSFKVNDTTSVREQSEPSNPQPLPVNRKRPAESPFERNDRSPIFHNLSGQYLSHLIVDIVSPEELKRLLSVLIDNGFTRFQHVGSSDMDAYCSREGIHRAPRARIERAQNGAQFDNSIRKGESPQWLSHASSENGRISASPGSNSGNSSVINSSGNRLQCVDFDVKLEPFMEEDEELEEELDEQTAELESQLASEAMKKGLALFGKGPSPRKIRPNKYGFHNSLGETVTVFCAMCGSEIRLNSGGSKWNFFEHVMMKHSTNKPFKCPHCPYQAGRKLRVRQHGQSQHHMATEPIDMTTPEMRTEWLQTMSECFPEHQYGRNVKF